MYTHFFSILGSAESNASDFVPTKLRRETTMLKKLPTIPQGKVADGTYLFLTLTYSSSKHENDQFNFVELVKNYTVTMETCRGVSAILSYLNISSF